MLDTQDFLSHDIHKIQNPGTSIQDPGSANIDTGFRINALLLNERFYATVGLTLP
jgi:hypothetical protein